MNELTANTLIALWVVPLLQWAKRSNLPMLRWINENTAMLVSAGIACFTALGLHWEYDSTTGNFGITGSTAMLLHAATQFTLQHTGHKGYIALETVKDIGTKLSQFTEWQVKHTKEQDVALGIPKEQ